ncbi:pupal cuticle protein 36a-like [Pollicipes pollicipes]|uniref:pupal cuticle protein 36a-like n=1 Tax=Pollicipes pollicipes TaxID=41117 RepID=UPI00188518F0|nr:pupal cuticle protein 36a-like [Pollicipes pollicipes]
MCRGGQGGGGQHSLKDTIPGGGEPGVDYPTLAVVPETSFSCEDYSTGGYYADINDPALCQVFHICYDNRMDSFLCPNGTLFNQKYFVCDWWYNVDCAASESFFQLNEEIGKTDASGSGSGSGGGSNGGGVNNGYGAPSGAGGSGGNGFGNGGSGGSVNSGYGAPTSGGGGAGQPSGLYGTPGF